MTKSLGGKRPQTSTLNIRTILAKFPIEWYLTKKTMANISQINDAMIGGGGRIKYFGTGAQTGLLCDYVIIRGTSQVTVLTDENDVDLITELGLAGLNLPAFWILRAPYGRKIKNITLTSGGAAYWF